MLFRSTTLPGEFIVRFIVLLSLFDLTQGRVRSEKAGQLTRNVTSNQRRCVLPGKMNTMENCARCNWGLATLPGEVAVQFIVLRSLFDRTQGRIRGGKVSQVP